MNEMKKIIVKVGTTTLTQGTQKLSRRYMLGLVQQIAELSNRGLQLILVSSGAVATGKELLYSSIEHQSVPSKQICASIGQIKLMQLWSELFSLFDLQIAQVLLSRDDFSEHKWPHTRDIILDLLSHRIIPIINENDTVATQEAYIGNNDMLAALLAQMIAADTIILLTDQEGLYTADPRYNPQAQLIPIVEHIDDAIFSLASDSSSFLGTGGMMTKIEAAQMASKLGIRTIVASSAKPNILKDLVEGQRIGTLFLEEGGSI